MSPPLAADRASVMSRYDGAAARLVRLGLLLAYAVPSALGFSTGRHFSLFILMSALGAFFPIIDEMPDPRAGRERP
jgi:hypothetical protein